MKDKCTRAGSWVHAVGGASVGHVTRVKGLSLFIVRDIRTVYKVLIYFHQIITLRIITRVTIEMNVEGRFFCGSGDTVVQFFARTIWYFCSWFPTAVHVSASARERLSGREEFVISGSVRVASEPRGRRSRCFRRSRWQSSAVRKPLVWPPSVVFWPPDAACRCSSPSPPWSWPLPSSLVCGTERTSPPGDVHWHVKYYTH